MPRAKKPKKTVMSVGIAKKNALNFLKSRATISFAERIQLRAVS